MVSVLDTQVEKKSLETYSDSPNKMLSTSILLKIGGLGFSLGFVSYVAWILMVILSLEGLLRYGTGFFQFDWMSGVFFQAPASRLIFYGLLSFSSLFSAIGCFALTITKKLWLGFINGIFFLVTFVLFASFPPAFFLELILWGTTLLIIAEKIGAPNLGRAAGIILLIAGAFGILSTPVVIFWGFEIWIMMFGWLYAAGALMSAIIFFRRTRNNPEIKRFTETER
jgi:hypothetical protein